jgi:hypothetical protein
MIDDPYRRIFETRAQFGGVPGDPAALSQYDETVRALFADFTVSLTLVSHYDERSKIAHLLSVFAKPSWCAADREFVDSIMAPFNEVNWSRLKHTGIR